MLHLFLTPSPLLAAGEVLVGISLPMFVAALIAAYGDRIRLSGGRWARTDLCTPDPETGPPRGSYAVPAPHHAPTSARLPLESAKNFAQHLSWKTWPTTRHTPSEGIGPLFHFSVIGWRQ